MKKICPTTAAWSLLFLLMICPIDAHAVKTLSIQFQDTLRLISMDMPRRQVIETLGTPDIIKSEGMCLQYTSLGLSIYFNERDRVEQIYLARDFKGFLGKKDQTRGVRLEDIEKEFGTCTAVVEKLNYQPSPVIRTGATTETENQTDPTGKEKGEFPLQYPGNRKLYVFYNNGEPIKYKYVYDDEGIAFWLDHEKQLYVTVLYPPPKKEASLPAQEVMAKTGHQKTPLSLIHFDFDKHNIKKIYIPVLDEQVAFLNEHPSTPVTVHGHTDFMGSLEYNQRLSERRAEAVRRYLIEKGIASDRIKTVGHSKLKPLTEDRSAKGRALNRRAELEAIVNK